MGSKGEPRMLQEAEAASASSKVGTVVLQSVQLRQHGQRVNLPSSEPLHFDDRGIKLSDKLRVQWTQVAVADISVRDHGRQVQLVLCSNDHSAFDFVRLAMNMDVSSTHLMQMVHSRNIRLQSVGSLLLLGPIAKLYSSTCPFTTVFLVYNVACVTFEVLFGFLFLTGIHKKLTSSKTSSWQMIQQLQADIANIFQETKQDVMKTSSWWGILKDYITEKIPYGWLLIEVVVPAPVWYPFLIIWLIIEFMSESLTLLLLAQHFFGLVFYFNQIFYTISKSAKIIASLTRRTLHIVQGAKVNKKAKDE